MYLCEIGEISELTSKQFEYVFLGENRQGFVIKSQGKLYAYENHCPHTGVTLNWQENIFLSYDKTTIQCATHGAQFQLNDGLCIWGPCLGSSLTELPLKVALNKVYLVLNE